MDANKCLLTDDVAELYCTESLKNSNHDNKKYKRVASTPYYPLSQVTEKVCEFTSSSDDLLVEDPRVIQLMLQSELSTVTTAQYLHTSGITSHMRNVLLRWLYEVVSDQKMEDVVFVLTANLVDRFLSSAALPKQRLQLLGCCCLLLASKMRNCFTVSAEMLAYLSAGSITEDEICRFEVVVLTQLNWDLSPVLPSDYLEPILRQAGVVHVQHIRKHTTIFLSMLTLHSSFLGFPSSVIACATVYAALTYCEDRAVPTKQLLSFIAETFTISERLLAHLRGDIYRYMEMECDLNDSAKDVNACDVNNTAETGVDRREPFNSEPVSVNPTGAPSMAEKRVSVDRREADSTQKGSEDSVRIAKESDGDQTRVNNQESFNMWSPSSSTYESVDSTNSDNFDNTSSASGNNGCVGDLTPTDIMDISLE